ncbi:unnamed protein product, partial [Didymodactylos carnosus]
LPRHLQFGKAAVQLKQDLLKIEIKYKCRLLSRVHRHSKNIVSHFQPLVNPIVVEKLQIIKCSLVNDKGKTWKETLVNKLLKLSSNRQTPKLMLNTVNPILNYSKRVLSEQEEKALVNGLIHVYPSTTLNKRDLISSIEYFYTKLLGFKTEYRDYERKDVNEIISHKLTPVQINGAMKLRRITDNFINHTERELRRNRSLLSNFKKVLRNLSNDNSIVIYKLDKGRGVVILDKSEYIEKMNDIVNDMTAFKRITIKPTISKEDKLTRLLLQLRKRGFINDAEYKLARPVGSRFARLYGLPKVHKPNRPIRPILSSVKTFNYGLGLMLAKRLKHLRSSPSIVKSSFQFANIV